MGIGLAHQFVGLLRRDRLRSTIWPFVAFVIVQVIFELGWMDPADGARYSLAFMPFTYSITAGIGAGFIAYVVLKVVKGKVADIHPLLWIIAALFVVYFAIEPVTNWVS